MSKTARLSSSMRSSTTPPVDASGEEQRRVLVGADEAHQGGEPASIVGVEVEVVVVDAGPSRASL